MLLGSFPGPAAAWAQDVETVAASAKKDLQAALEELSSVRAEIEGEKLPLAREVNALERSLLEARKDLEKKERFQDNQLVELNALKTEVKARRDAVQYVDALLTEYSRAFRTRINIVEEPKFKVLLAPIEAATASPDLSDAERMAQRLELLRISMERARSAAGGHVTEASVVAPDGRIVQGKAALLGPLAVFASADGQVAGIVQQELNKADPSVIPLPAALNAEITSLVQSGSGRWPVDPTLGNALKIASTKESLSGHIAKGGVVMWPILMLAAAALVVAVIKWVQLSRIQLASDKDLQTVLEQLSKGNRSAALARARSIAGPAGLLLATAVDHMDEKKEYLEEVLYERMLNAKPRLEALLPFIALTAAAAPLLGLLGTVTGMISTFNMISLFGTGDPRTLSSGISEALITTEYGLLVAIPAVMIHAFLNRRVKGIIASMEHTAIGFVNGIPGQEEPEAWARHS
jgi:biopolymer transport protein ExbB